MSGDIRLMKAVAGDLRLTEGSAASSYVSM